MFPSLSELFQTLLYGGGPPVGGDQLWLQFSKANFPEILLVMKKASNPPWIYVGDCSTDYSAAVWQLSTVCTPTSGYHQHTNAQKGYPSGKVKTFPFRALGEIMTIK